MSYLDFLLLERGHVSSLPLGAEPAGPTCDLQRLRHRYHVHRLLARLRQLQV